MVKIISICMFAMVSLPLSIKAQQSLDTSFFDQSEFHRVVISHYYVNDKTHRSSSNKQSEEKISERELTKLEVSMLFKHLQNNLRNWHAMDSQEVFIEFYSGHSIKQKLTFSFNTGNVKLKKEGCERRTNEELGTTYDPCLYLGNANADFIIFIAELLQMKPNDVLNDLLERTQ